jgi:hypothetical protein
MPSIKLIEAEVTSLRARHPQIADKIRVIHSDDDDAADLKVIVRLSRLLTAGTADGGWIVFITHEAFLRLPHWHRRDRWHLFVDEVIETLYWDRFNLYENRDILLSHLSVAAADANYSILRAKNPAAIEAWGRNLNGDEITARFSALASKLKAASHWTLCAAGNPRPAVARSVRGVRHGHIDGRQPETFADVFELAADGLHLHTAQTDRQDLEIPPTPTAPG